MVEKKIKQGILLHRAYFNELNGLFPLVYSGKLTEIATLFEMNNELGELDVAQIQKLCAQKDKGGRTPIDIAW